VELYLRLLYPEDRSLLVSKAIRAMTGGSSHVAAEFWMVSEGSTRVSRVYFESIAKVDSETHKSGVRGPIPSQKLVDWVAGKSTRHLVIQPAPVFEGDITTPRFLPLTQDEAFKAWSLLESAVPTTGYARAQLAQNLLALLPGGLRFTWGSGSDTRWTCCETIVRGRVIPPRFWDHLHMDTITADELTPGGSSIFSLYAGVARMLEEHPPIRVAGLAE
jgi:hypothetical protein